MQERSRYKWMITSDIQGRRHSAFIEGPRNCDRRPAEDLPDHFRLLDGDQNPLYEGRTDCLTHASEYIDGFEPLDDFGRPFAGCTAIEYMIKGVWVEL